jgi:ribosome-binding factor A
MADRLGRVDEMLKREISVILAGDIDDPLVKSVTITKVEVSRDLSLAKIFYTVFGEKLEKELVSKGLKRAARFIRGKIAKRISLKSIPELSFREDKEEEQEVEIEKLFSVLEKERKTGEDKNEERAQDE